MNKYRILLMVTVLIFASLACQALTGGSEPEKSNVNSQPSDGGNVEGGSNESSSGFDFPMTDDAFNVIDVGDGSLLYYTKMSGDDVMNFYRNEYISRGYTENELLTVDFRWCVQHSL